MPKPPALGMIQYVISDIDDVCIETDPLRVAIKEDFLRNGCPDIITPAQLYQIANDIPRSRLNGHAPALASTLDGYVDFMQSLPVQPVEGVHDFYDVLDVNKIPVGYLSRGIRELQLWKLRMAGLYERSQGPFVFTGDFSGPGARATKHQLFPLVLQQIHAMTGENIDPSAVLYIDDRIEHVFSAHTYGMQAVHFQREHKEIPSNETYAITGYADLL